MTDIEFKDEDLKQIAKDLHAGKIFCSIQCKTPEEVTMVFPVLLMMDAKQIQELESAKIDFFYEYLDKAAPISVNGMPCFLSARMLPPDAAKKMLKYYDKIVDAVGKALA